METTEFFSHETAIDLLFSRNLAEWYALEPQHLSNMIRAVITSADVAEGYKHITWKACDQLLSAIDKTDALVEDCFLPAIAQALHSATQNGEWYYALGFMDLPWPDDTILENLLGSPDFHRIIASCTELPFLWQLSPDTCRNLPASVRHQLVMFLANAHQAGIPLSIRYQVSASLLIALDPSSGEFALASECFLHSLEEGGMRGLAFVIWRSLADVSTAVATESQYLSGLQDYVDQGLECDTKFLDLIMPLVSDDLLLQACDINTDLCIALGTLAFHGIELGGNGELGSVVFRLLQPFSRIAPSIAAAIRSRLTTPERDREPTANEVAEFDEIIKNLRFLLERRRTYRGLPLAQEIWRHNITHVFAPAVEDIYTGRELAMLSDSVLKRLDARKLVEDCPPQRESTHPIEGDVLANLTRDTEEVVNLIYQAHDILLRSPGVTRYHAESSNQALAIELGRLAGIGPLSAWSVDRFLKQHFCIL